VIPIQTLDRLKGLHRTLLRNRDSERAWSDLAGLFAALDDARRSRLCEGVARNLRRLPAA
jgi:hypothetical protein